MKWYYKIRRWMRSRKSLMEENRKLRKTIEEMHRLTLGFGDDDLSIRP